MRVRKVRKKFKDYFKFVLTKVPICQDELSLLSRHILPFSFIHLADLFGMKNQPKESGFDTVNQALIGH
jgi:hypothetical protein